jgi:secreted trypsin-like serine protease
MLKALSTSLLLASVTVVSTPALAGPQSQSQGITRGQDENGFPAVSALVWNDDSRIEFCTSTYIAPKILLTAAHCVDGLSSSQTEEARAFFGNEIGPRGETIRWREVRVHPQYEDLGNIGDSQGDIAMIILRAAPDSTAPMRTRLVELTEFELCPGAIGCTAVEDPIQLLAVGFGTVDDQGGNTRKRSAWLKVGGFGQQYSRADEFIVTDDDDANICSGDSGGPLFFQREDGQFVQWGVTSWSPSFVSCGPGVAGFTRVDAFREWVLDAVEDEHGSRDLCEVNGWYEDGFCDRNCPQDDSDCKQGCGSSLIPGAAGPAFALLPPLLAAAWRRRSAPGPSV